MKAAKNSKEFNRNVMPTTKKKKLLKRKGNRITPAKTNVTISQTSSEGLKLIIQTYQMRKHQKHLCQLVLI